MIIFDLTCEQEHRFEGWFRDATTYEAQLQQQLVRCPQCDSASVRKLPSAVAIATHRPAPPVATENSSASVSASLSKAAPTYTQVLSLYKQLSEALATVSEDVGHAFADEARRMHYEEIPERPIRGHATSDEVEELQDEGIAVMRLPIIKDEELN